MSKGIRERIGWIDSLRFLAILWIAIVHFIFSFSPQLASMWSEGWTRFFLCGLTGKLAVALFCVLLGYFVAENTEKEYDTGSYMVRRYVFFMYPMLIMNIIKCILMYIDQYIDIHYEMFDSDIYTWKKCIIDSVRLGKEITPTFWCMKIFFVATLIIWIMNRAKIKFGVQIAVSLFFLLTKEIWITICIWGGLVYIIVKEGKMEKVLGRRWLRWLSLIIGYMVIQRQESYFTYVLDGLFCVYILLAGFYSKTMQNSLEQWNLPKLGQLSYYVYLVHITVQFTFAYCIESKIFDGKMNMSSALLLMVGTLGLDVVIAFAMSKLCRVGIRSILEFIRRE